MRHLLTLPILLYRKLISRLTPPSCRFRPTCSAYAVTALRRHGALRGTRLALWRLLRCHPFTEADYDAVPPVSGKNVPGTVRITDGRS